jgi:hypothetical protein
VKAMPATRELPWLRWQLGAQATRSGVATVELTTAGPALDLEPLSLALLDGTAPKNGGGSGRSRSRRGKAANGRTVTIEAPTNGHAEDHSANGSSLSGLKIRVLDRTDHLSFHANGSAGIVVVVPTVVKRTDMDSAKDLLSLTGWPAVGVIAYRRGPLASTLGRLSAKSKPARV